MPRGAWSHRRVVLGAALMVQLLSGCERAPAEPGSPTLTRVRVILSPHLSWGPLVLAREKGFFAEEGLEVEFVTLLRTEESLVALLGGEVDVLPGPLHPGLLTAIARGADVRIVAGMNHLAREGCTYHAVVLRPGLGPAEAARRLRRVDASRDGSSRYLVSRMLATQGVDIDSLDTVRLPVAVIEHSLNEGSVDAAGLTEPMVTRSLRTASLWLRSQDATPDFQWGVIAFGERLLRREPALGARFLAAYRRGIIQFGQGKTPENVADLVQATGEERETLMQSCWPEFRADARINLASVLEYQQWALDHNYLDRPAAPAQLWDSSLVAASDSILKHRAMERQR